jgi:NAD(P)H-dependent FMN reductase
MPELGYDGNGDALNVSAEGDFEEFTCEVRLVSGSEGSLLSLAQARALRQVLGWVHAQVARSMDRERPVAEREQTEGDEGRGQRRAA